MKLYQVFFKLINKLLFLQQLKTANQNLLNNKCVFLLQGLDSWFVPAFSAIADSTVLLNHVIPPDQGFTKHENYCGIFHFRFWFGRWIEIVIDDLLPTRKGINL